MNSRQRETEGIDPERAFHVGPGTDAKPQKTACSERLAEGAPDRNPKPGLIHHCAIRLRRTWRLEARAIRISMSRAGNPYDNAKAERFMRTLKEEEVNGKTYAS